MCADVVSWTDLSSELQPDQLVDLLRDMYGHFDCAWGEAGLELRAEICRNTILLDTFGHLRGDF